MLKKFRPILIFIVALAASLFLFSDAAYAHIIPYDLKKLGTAGVALVYLEMGFEHILPLGLDHILFICGLFLLNPNLKKVILQASVFTIAHSITLGIAMYGLVSPPDSVIEPIIALSILFIAVENIITRELKPWRLLIIFIFGLIHGFGFAGALGELGLPQDKFFSSLIMFNVGVELGQLTIIMIMFILVGKWFSAKDWYRKRIVYPASACIGAMALYWTIERVFFV